MSGFQTNLSTGIAQLLAAAGVGTYRSDGSSYLASEKAIVIKLVPESPDAIFALSTYPVSDDPSLSDSVIGLQVTTRAGGQDPRAVDDYADAAFDQLHGLHDATLATGVHVVECLHRSGSSLGQDDLKRWGRVDNYYVTVWRPSPNRL
jgi:hypothetical protein